MCHYLTTHAPSQIVQQLVDERLRVLELTIFKKKFQELKDRVDKIDCATKHQTAVTTLQVRIPCIFLLRAVWVRSCSKFPSPRPRSKTLSSFFILQAKINRLTKKFGEANQASENKRKADVRTVVFLLLLRYTLKSLHLVWKKLFLKAP